MGCGSAHTVLASHARRPDSILRTHIGSVMMHAWDPSVEEVKADRPEVQNHLRLHEFKPSSLEYTRPCLKIKTSFWFHFISPAAHGRSHQAVLDILTHPVRLPCILSATGHSSDLVRFRFDFLWLSTTWYDTSESMQHWETYNEQPALLSHRKAEVLATIWSVRRTLISLLQAAIDSNHPELYFIREWKGCCVYCLEKKFLSQVTVKDSLSMKFRRKGLVWVLLFVSPCLSVSLFHFVFLLKQSLAM